jgi:hypothetical protein
LSFAGRTPVLIALIRRLGDDDVGKIAAKVGDTGGGESLGRVRPTFY